MKRDAHWLWMVFLVFWCGWIASAVSDWGLIAGVHLCIALTALALWLERKEKRPGL